jgi:hypothetical protein
LLPAPCLELSQNDNYIAVSAPPDPAMDVLLDLDGQVLVVDPSGRH